MNKPASIAEAREGLSFANVLRERLVCGVLLIDGRERVMALTGQANRLLGLSPDPATLPAFAALPAPIQTLVRETLSSGKAPSDQQVTLKADSRGAVTLRISAVPYSPGQQESGVMVVLNDLTPAGQLDEHLEQLDRLANVGTLAASMAHEIKNALVAGKTFIDLLLERHQDAELVEVVRREMGRIDALVTRMLKFAGPARPVFSEVRLHEILDHSLRLVQAQLDGKTITLSRSFGAAPDLVRGDDCQLQQAFVNLFLNALEAMGPRGTLSVATELTSAETTPAGEGAARLHITVKDDGPGIPPGDLARLFEPFFTTKSYGTGLGLPITRRIILEHRGTITVESQPGRGTAFHILLPGFGLIAGAGMKMGVMRTCTLGILSDIHYAGPAEQARGKDYELRAIANPKVRALANFYRHVIWLRDPLQKNYLLDQFLDQPAAFDYVIANGDYSCNTAFVGLSDDAAFESVRECLGKLRQRFGDKLRVNYGDHELGKFTMFGGPGGMRLASWRRVREDLSLPPFWQVEVGRYVLMGLVSSLVALPASQAEMLPAERPEWERLRAEHLGEIRRAFAALRPDQRVLLFCHDPTALPFLWREEALRARVSQIEQTVIGHLHSKLVLWKSRLLTGMPPIRFLGHTVERFSTALSQARLWRPFNVRLCPSLAGIELLKDGGYYTARLDPEARQPARFEFHRLHRS